MNALINDDSRKHTTEVHVVPSQYALALQEKNRKISVGPVNKRGKSVPGVIKHSSHGITRAPSATVAKGIPSPAAPMSLNARRESYHSGNPKSADLVAQKAKTPNSSIASVLHSTPRPAFPTRISSNMKRSSRSINTEDSLSEGDTAVCEHAHSADTSLVKECDERSELQNKLTVAEAQTTSLSAEFTEVEELELLQSLYYQLCFVEAKAEDTFRRQEQRAEAQMMAAWKILQSKLHKLQITSLRLDRQRQSEVTENQLVNLAEPTAQLAQQLPHALDSISQLCASVEIALSRLRCLGITWANPLQLKQHMESLTLEFDNLQENIETAHICDIVSDAVSLEHDIQRLFSKSTEALLQVAHLVTKLETERKQDTRSADTNNSQD